MFVGQIVSQCKTQVKDVALTLCTTLYCHAVIYTYTAIIFLFVQASAAGV